MYKVAVMGDRDSVYGFAALGLDTFFTEDTDEAAKLIRRLSGDGYAVIYITEQLASLLADELAKLSELPLPAVIPIPGVYGNNGMGMKAVSEAVIKAVGSEII
jgi:V/A-type H+-transporting ATPase subunit F